MARNSKTQTKKKPTSRPAAADGKGRVRRGRRKVCQFCEARADWVDYKDVNILRRYMNDRGRIRARGATGTCRQHQRDVAIAIKTARELALLPYSVRTSATGPGERRGGGRHAPSSPPDKSDDAEEATTSSDLDSSPDEMDERDEMDSPSSGDD
jgi:small subunit ribosomal protein S18